MKLAMTGKMGLQFPTTPWIWNLYPDFSKDMLAFFKTVLQNLTQEKKQLCSQEGEKIQGIFQYSFLSTAQWHKITNHKVSVWAIMFPGPSDHYNMEKTLHSPPVYLQTF